MAERQAILLSRVDRSYTGVQDAIDRAHRERDPRRKLAILNSLHRHQHQHTHAEMLHRFRPNANVILRGNETSAIMHLIGVPGGTVQTRRMESGYRRR